jgi:hypothetical protein
MQCAAIMDMGVQSRKRRRQNFDEWTVSHHLHLICVGMLIYHSVKGVHWFHAKAQFEWWLKEQHSIHNEAHWISAFFHSTTETWKVLMSLSSREFLRGHKAYASYQMHAWEELSKSSRKALASITDAPLKHYNVEFILSS